MLCLEPDPAFCWLLPGTPGAALFLSFFPNHVWAAAASSPELNTLHLTRIKLDRGAHLFACADVTDHLGLHEVTSLNTFYFRRS